MKHKVNLPVFHQLVQPIEGFPSVDEPQVSHHGHRHRSIPRAVPSPPTTGWDERFVAQRLFITFKFVEAITRNMRSCVTNPPPGRECIPYMSDDRPSQARGAPQTAKRSSRHRRKKMWPTLPLSSSTHAPTSQALARSRRSTPLTTRQPPLSAMSRQQEYRRPPCLHHRHQQRGWRSRTLEIVQNRRRRRLPRGAGGYRNGKTSEYPARDLPRTPGGEPYRDSGRRCLPLSSLGCRVVPPEGRFDAHRGEGMGEVGGVVTQWVLRQGMWQQSNTKLMQHSWDHAGAASNLAQGHLHGRMSREWRFYTVHVRAR